MGTRAESRMGWYCGHRVPCPSGYNVKPPGNGHEPSLVFKGAVGLLGCSEQETWLSAARGAGGREALRRLLCTERYTFCPAK